MNSSALKYFRAVAAASLLAFSVLSIYAQSPGKLDLSFAGTGYKLETLPNGAPIQGTDILVQPDGKVLAAVTSQVFVGGMSFALRRLNPDGSMDMTFGNAGMVTTLFITPQQSSTGEIRSLALQPDGKILAGGYSVDAQGAETFTIVRYNPNGTLDTSFGVDGKSAIDFDVPCLGNHLAIAPDGKIILAGSQKTINNVGTLSVMVARYNSNGTRDTSFDTDGYTITTLLDWNSSVTGLQVQPDGKMIVAGRTKTGSNFGMMRFNIDGSVDTSFGTGGLATTIIGTGTSNIAAIELLPDGRILAGGTASNSGTTDFALARYNTDGSLDTSFDGDGMVLTPVGAGNDTLRGIVVQSDGKIVAVGSSSNDFSFARWNIDGSVDTTFGTNGKTIVNLGGTETASGLALDPLGRATFAGRSNNALITGRLRSENQPQVNVAGRLMSVGGNPISNVVVVMQDEDLNTRFVLSNGFGYYNFTNVPVGATYTISLSSKRFSFSPESQTVGVTDAVLNIDFLGTPNEGRMAPAEATPVIKTTRTAKTGTIAEPVKKGGKQALK
ncbi:MAG TPA: hypothetical protein VGO50_08535 [Pyrinomonadaceae bacterium]|jgi:uncharacterized delta-60 repeat protein|nr:hypothetical protein [Pyrinomonadaceae bacterium]